MCFKKWTKYYWCCLPMGIILLMFFWGAMFYYAIEMEEDTNNNNNSTQNSTLFKLVIPQNKIFFNPSNKSTFENYIKMQNEEVRPFIDLCPKQNNNCTWPGYCYYDITDWGFQNEMPCILIKVESSTYHQSRQIHCFGGDNIIMYAPSNQYSSDTKFPILVGIVINFKNINILRFHCTSSIKNFNNDRIDIEIIKGNDY